MKASLLAVCWLVFSAEIGEPVTVKAQNVTVTIPKSTADAIGDQSRAGKTLVDLLKATDIATGQDQFPVPMRDGVELSASVVRPRNAPHDAKLPTLLIKTPYWSEEIGTVAGNVARAALREGYAVVLVNDRGQEWSQGSYSWLRGANHDNSDMLDWVERQPWSNGRIGAIGCSSSGEWMLPFGAQGHRGLKALVPMGASTGIGDIPGYTDKGSRFTGGVPNLFWDWWFYSEGYRAHPELPRGLAQSQRARIAAAFLIEPTLSLPKDFYDHLPAADLMKIAGSPASIFDDIIELTPDDIRWNDFDMFRQGEQIKVPTLIIDSWFDLISSYPTTKYFEYGSKNSTNLYMIMGATMHCDQGSETRDTTIGDIHVGDAQFDWTSTIMRFLDHWVKNDGNGEYNEPKVRYYLMRDRWRQSSAWPLPEAHAMVWALTSGGHANSLYGDGSLDVIAQPGSAPSDTFVSDPTNPVQSKGGACCDPAVSVDQRNIEARSDVLVYTGAILTEDLDIAGYITANVQISADTPDVDLTFKLVDVDENNHALNILDTIQRVSYRGGIKHSADLQPGRVYSVSIDHAVTAIRVPKGHRLRVEIAGSSFPTYERNMQTGGNNAKQTQSHQAHITLWHSPEHQSYLSLPVLPKTG